MSKSGDKTLRALEEAVEIAKCKHDLKPQPHHGKELRKFYCPKCGATIWKPRIGGNI